MVDFAQFVKMLALEEYPDVETIRLVMDNLNTHKEKSFYEAGSVEEAERILDKIEFHYTPKHASWLNAAEIEINAWTKRRNGDEKKINWEFTSENADEKLSKHYVP